MRAVGWSMAVIDLPPASGPPGEPCGRPRTYPGTRSYLGLMASIEPRRIAVCLGSLIVLLLVACGGESGEQSSARSQLDGGRWESLPRIQGVGSARPDDVAGAFAGGEVVVVSGESSGRPSQRIGGVAFRPDGSAGKLIATSSTKLGVGSYSVIGDGRRVYVWGGCCPGSQPHGLATGAVYDPKGDRWQELPQAPFGAGGHSAVWADDQMIVWGGITQMDLRDGKAFTATTNEGLAYEPETSSWRAIASAPLTPRTAAASVWTGDEMLVVGGLRTSGADRYEPLRDGAAYDPAADSWRPIPDAPISLPSAATDVPVHGAEAVWTGSEMLLWNGREGAIYDPGADEWRVMAPAPLSPRSEHSTIWTGPELIVWGGCCDSSGDGWADGAIYDPGDDRWRMVPEAPVSGRRAHAGVWTDGGMLIWGGQRGAGSAEPLLNGALYEPMGN